MFYHTRSRFKDWKLKFVTKSSLFLNTFLNLFQQKILYIRSTVPPGRYLLVVHYFQPHFLSYEGKVIVTSGIIATSAQVNFRYCPYVSGCRGLGMSQGSGGRKKYFFIGSQSEILFTVVIPEDKSIWIVSCTA